MNESATRNQWRFKLHEVIFGADTPAGKWFDVLLIYEILNSNHRDHRAHRENGKMRLLIC